MSNRALVVGGTGQIDTTVAKLLAASGWKVTTCDRGSRAPNPELAELGVQRHLADRRRPGELGAGADVLVDTVEAT